DVAALEFDVERAFLDRAAIDLDGFLLGRGEFRHARKLLRLVDDGAHAGGAEIPIDEREDRLLQIRQLARADLAAARAVEILRQYLHQIGMALEHAVMDRYRAGDPARAAALRCLQTKEADRV